MTTNPFDPLPPPQPISALWATRALLVYPDMHMVDDCLTVLESTLIGANSPQPDPDTDMMTRLLNMQKAMAGMAAPSIPDTIEINVISLAKIVRLDYFECRVLELAAMLVQDEWLHTFCARLPVPHDTKATYVIAAMLNIGFNKTASALATTGGLHLAGLLEPRGNQEWSISKLLALSSENAHCLAQNQFNPFDLLKDTVEPSLAPRLHALDFSHIRATLDILKGYTSSQALNTRQGANILIHGPSGSGKSELTKSVMQTANRRLLEVPFLTGQLEVLDAQDRLKAYLRAQVCLKPSHTVLLFDHFECIFQTALEDELKQHTCPNELGWLYRIMEYNPIPTFWLTNSLHGIPAAFLSRMDALFEIPPPNAVWHTSMLHRLRRSKQLNFNPEIVSGMKGMTPGVMDRVIQTAALFEDTQDDAKPSRVLKFLVASFQKAKSNGSDDKENQHE